MEPSHYARVGRPAPYFDMRSTRDLETLEEHARLPDYRGQWLILLFYPADFSLACPTEIRGFRDHYERVRSLEADVLGVSTDSVFSHRAWIETSPERNGVGALPFPLASDITKSVSRHYGVLDEDAGMALRALFIIDPEGILRYQVVHDVEVGRTVDDTLRVLQALQAGAPAR